MVLCGLETCSILEIKLYEVFSWQNVYLPRAKVSLHIYYPWRNHLPDVSRTQTLLSCVGYVWPHKCEEPWKCSLQTKPDNPQRITLMTTGSVPHTLTNAATRPKDAAEPHSPHTDLVCRDHSGTLVGWPGSISSVLPVDDLQGVPGRCFGLGSCCSALCDDTT